MLRAVIYDILRGYAADMQPQSYLIHAGGIDIDFLPALSGCNGAICAWTWHAALIGWRGFANGQHVDLLAVGQGRCKIQ